MTRAFVRRFWERVGRRRDELRPPHDAARPPLTQEEYRAVRFALDFVDRLGAEHGFDPAELVNPRTGQPFGPFIQRLRRVMLRVELAGEPERYLDDQSARDVSERKMTGWATGGESLY